MQISSEKSKRTLEYKVLEEYNIDQLFNLYTSVGWTSYTNNKNLFKAFFDNSLYMYGAFYQNELIGLIRVVGDGVTIIYIQDLLINPKFQRQGIGAYLMNHVLALYKDVRQKVLLTDNTSQTNQFYKSLGFKDTNDLKLVCFYK